MAKLDEKRKFVKSSENLAFGTGIARAISFQTEGLSKPATKTIKFGGRSILIKTRAFTKAGKIGVAISTGLGVGSLIQNIRGSSGFGEFLGRQFITNPLRALGGGLAGTIAAKGALNPAIRSAAAFGKRKRTGKVGEIIDVTPGKAGVIFRRIRGRIIPIRRKKRG